MLKAVGGRRLQKAVVVGMYAVHTYYNDYVLCIYSVYVASLLAYCHIDLMPLFY